MEDGKKISNTTSLCEQCYMHVPATVFEKDGSIWLGKTCLEHGYTEHMIERDADFYHNLHYNHDSEFTVNGTMIEVTDRCNLNCPHCYHEPENKTTDRSIASILTQMSAWPSDSNAVILAGAEPTLRKDLPELIMSIKEFWRSRRPANHPDIEVIILTNGVKFSNIEFCRKLEQAGTTSVLIGMNHKSYQGEVVHNKQIQGIKNCKEAGLFVYYVGYTLETHEHLPEVLEEIQSLGDVAYQYRIRAGSDIGRSPEEERLYLSDNVRVIKQIAEDKGWQWKDIDGDDNLYHYMVKINGLNHRIIQWCDDKTIELNELNHGPWCDFVPGKPISNFLHQIMLRDRLINEQKPLLDTVPQMYQFRALP